MNYTNQLVETGDEEEKLLDEAGYDLDIPESEWPRSDEEWGRRHAQERDLLREIKTRLGVFLPDLDTEQLVNIIRSKNLEEIVFKWADIHRKTRSIMRKQKGSGMIMLIPTSQCFLRASDLLKQ